MSEQFDKLSAQYSAARDRWKQMMDRLTAENEQLRAQLTTLTPIVEAVAKGGVGDLLSEDGVERCLWTPESARALIVQARAALATP
jgi:hypothetical protein